jgi:hypothetical protein
MKKLTSRLAILTLAIPAIWVIAFHIALLWQRVADSSIGQPSVLGRWIVSAILMAFAPALFRRRFGLIFWLIVLLLHAVIPADERITTGQDAIALILIFAVAVFLAAACFDLLRTAIVVLGIADGRPTILPISLPPRAPPAS